MSILGFYGVLGRRLRSYRAGLWCLAGLAVLVFVATIFRSGPSDDQTLALGSIVLLLWALSLIVVAEAFSVPAPTPDPAARFAQRVRIRLVRGLRWFMAITTTGLFGLVILLSFKAVGLWLRS